MVTMAVVMIGTSAVTYSYAGMQTRRAEMPSGIVQFDREREGSSSDGKFEKGLPNGNSNSGRPDMNGNSQQQSPGSNTQQPQAPSGDSQQAPDSNAQQPQAPRGDSQQTPDNNAQQPQAPSQDNSEESKNSSNTSLESDAAEIVQLSATESAMPKGDMKQTRGGSTAVSVICYIFLAVQIAILLMIIAYLIASKMNKISFSELFPDEKKITA